MSSSVKFKIGYFADGPWSHLAFEKLISDPTISIEFIVPRTDSEDQTLLIFSEKYKIPYIKGYNVNSSAFLDIAIEFKCDLFVSMSFNQIFKKTIISTPKLGTINCHAGKLPFYRGRNILNWALINDEKEFGITVHYVDEGIDTGDIILQNSYNITDEDNYASLLSKAYVGCAETLFLAIKNIQTGNSQKIKQSTIHPVGFYCGPRSIGDEVINWNNTSRNLFNFIRAICDPGPKAHTTIHGNIIKINRANLIENAPSYKNTNGQIVGKIENRYIVKTLDSTIEIYDIESNVKLKIGDKLGT